jgi:prevent-host-death family protein
VDVVSQREMRNNSGEILRRVAAGESILITNGGAAAAVLSPASSSVRDRLVAAGRLRLGTGLDIAALPPPVATEQSMEALLEQDRE